MKLLIDNFTSLITSTCMCLTSKGCREEEQTLTVKSSENVKYNVFRKWNCLYFPSASRSKQSCASVWGLQQLKWAATEHRLISTMIQHVAGFNVQLWLCYKAQILYSILLPSTQSATADALQADCFFFFLSFLSFLPIFLFQVWKCLCRLVRDLLLCEEPHR